MCDAVPVRCVCQGLLQLEDERLDDVLPLRVRPFHDLCARPPQNPGKKTDTSPDSQRNALPAQVVRMFCIDVMRAVCGRLTAVIGYEQGAEADGGAVNTP